MWLSVLVFYLEWPGRANILLFLLRQKTLDANFLPVTLIRRQIVNYQSEAIEQHFKGILAKVKFFGFSSPAKHRIITATDIRIKFAIIRRMPRNYQSYSQMWSLLVQSLAIPKQPGILVVIFRFHLNRKLNLYLGFLSTKRANPIRFPMNLGGPISLTESPVQAQQRGFMKSCPSIHLVAPTCLHALYGCRLPYRRTSRRRLYFTFMLLST